eukprot:gene20588-26696_t
MSFNDVAKQRSVRSGSSNTNGTSNRPTSTQNNNINDPIAQLGELLQNLQKSAILLRDKITEMRRRKVGQAEKAELEGKFKDIRELESQIKIKLDSQFKSLEGLPRAEVAQKRLGLGKLQKDYDRLKTLLQGLSNESSLIKISATDSISNNSKRSSNNINDDIMNSDRIVDDSGRGFGKEKTLIALKEVDIDSLIIEERERDIKKINHDILLVNEMFKDMANIVETQGSMIEEIKTTTDKSHEQAQAGLEQVKQAASHQSSCIIS